METSTRKGRNGQPGLSLRMQRERRVISSQHRQLDDLYALLAAALDQRRTADARAAFLRFSDALEAHFSLEDGLYFPALRGLAPALGRDLAALENEHHTLRETLAALARRFEAETCCEECVLPLERLVGDLAEHEGREEGLLSSLELGKER